MRVDTSSFIPFCIFSDPSSFLRIKHILRPSTFRILGLLDHMGSHISILLPIFKIRIMDPLFMIFIFQSFVSTQTLISTISQLVWTISTVWLAEMVTFCYIKFQTSPPSCFHIKPPRHWHLKHQPPWIFLDKTSICVIILSMFWSLSFSFSIFSLDRVYSWRDTWCSWVYHALSIVFIPSISFAPIACGCYVSPPCESVSATPLFTVSKLQ